VFPQRGRVHVRQVRQGTGIWSTREGRGIGSISITGDRDGVHILREEHHVSISIGKKKGGGPDEGHGAKKAAEKKKREGRCAKTLL